MRITSWWGKAIYLIVGYGIGVAFEWLVPLPYLMHYVVSTALFVTYIAVAVRVFRGRGESVAASRVWWRMTARPAIGFWIGGAFLVAQLALIDGGVRPAIGYDIADSAVQIAIGVLFLHSSIRLARSRQARPADPARSAA